MEEATEKAVISRYVKILSGKLKNMIFVQGDLNKISFLIKNKSDSSSQNFLKKLYSQIETKETKDSTLLDIYSLLLAKGIGEL
jgi:hypothetical protein